MGNVLRKPWIIVCWLSLLTLLELTTTGCSQNGTTGSNSCQAAPSIFLSTGELQAGFRGNSDCQTLTDNLSGVSLLVNNSSPTAAPFESVGLNFEHILSGHADPRNNFEPRQGKFVAHQRGSNAVTLIRNAEDSQWGMRTELTYTVTPPYYVDFEFVATPSRVDEFQPHDFVAFFFASYMSGVDSPNGFFFRGYPGPGLPEQWVNTREAVDFSGTTYMAKDATSLPHEDDAVLNLNLTTQDWPRIARPFYCGEVTGGMSYQIMFDQLYGSGEEIRFSNFKWNPQRPAWDFQFVVKQPQVARPYRLRGRMVWRPFVSLQHCADEYDAWLQQ